MATAPRFKVFKADGEYVGCTKEPTEAVVLVSVLGQGSQVRYGHSTADTLFSEGVSMDAAGKVIWASESYDAAVEAVNDSLFTCYYCGRSVADEPLNRVYWTLIDGRRRCCHKECPSVKAAGTPAEPIAGSISEPISKAKPGPEIAAKFYRVEVVEWDGKYDLVGYGRTKDEAIKQLKAGFYEQRRLLGKWVPEHCETWTVFLDWHGPLFVEEITVPSYTAG